MSMYYYDIKQSVVQETFPKRSYFPGKRQKLNCFVFIVLKKYIKMILHSKTGQCGFKSPSCSDFTEQPCCLSEVHFLILNNCTVSQLFIVDISYITVLLFLLLTDLNFV